MKTTNDFDLLPERFVRVFLKGSEFLDFDPNAYDIILEAKESGAVGCTIITSFGEVYWVDCSEVQAIVKKTKTAMIRQWEEAAQWEKLRKMHEGFAD